ncbi:hypothetical protein SPONL_1295 [uncultured Candidatus Thioglobus sp.]|nr:hypothetical protein SPONL_1295 [uncultured Candidatus Thioglobus sp.]
MYKAKRKKSFTDASAENVAVKTLKGLLHIRIITTISAAIFTDRKHQYMRQREQQWS